VDPELLDLLLALDGVQQSPRFHPEGDALFHSLQVFDLARRATEDRELWAAALFHDVGKAIDDDEQGHDEVGADLLEGLVSERVVWLVRHHLDLLRDPKRTRARLIVAGTSEVARLTPACSQSEIARRLGVSQQVIDKRLHGATRDGRRIGGALARLRTELACLR